MNGIVVCVSPRAAEEGAKVLEAGGNAFDAAVATAFVQMIVTPFSCGVAGMVSANIWAPDKGEHRILDGCMRAGSLVREDMWASDYLGEAPYTGSSLFEDFRSAMGYTSICTPGTVAGLAEVHRLYCTMPWVELLQPAISIARNGFLVSPELRNTSWLSKPDPHLPDTVTKLRATPDCARLYLSPEGSILEEGETIRNPDYANTLQQLATRGARDFYHGELASAMAEDLRSNGAFITREDFSSYRTTSYEPCHGSYRDYRIFTNSSPGGGPLLVEAVNVLDGIGIGKFRHGEVDYLSLIASTVQMVHQDRMDYLGDPETIGDEPGNVLLSRQRAARLRDAVLKGAVGGKTPLREEPNTTHLSVVDRDGNIASITHSLGNHSGVITPGLGFIYNNGMNRFDPRPGRASSFAPRKARLHLMIPTIILKDGVPVIAMGAPGGNAILSGLLQVFTNVVDYGMSAVEAVSAPRINAEGSKVWCEARTRSDTCEALRERGYDVIHDLASYARRRALVQLVIIGPKGDLDGASDPRGPSGVVYAREEEGFGDRVRGV